MKKSNEAQQPKAVFSDDLARLEIAAAHHHKRAEKRSEIHGDDDNQAIWHETKAEASMDAYFKIYEQAAAAPSPQTQFLGFLMLEPHEAKAVDDIRGTHQLPTQSAPPELATV